MIYLTFFFPSHSSRPLPIPASLRPRGSEVSTLRHGSESPRPPRAFTEKVNARLPAGRGPRGPPELLGPPAPLPGPSQWTEGACVPALTPASTSRCSTWLCLSPAGTLQAEFVPGPCSSHPLPPQPAPVPSLGLLRSVPLTSVRALLNRLGPAVCLWGGHSADGADGGVLFAKENVPPAGLA